MSEMRGSSAGDSQTTPWFDATVAPARSGVYARHAPAGPFACWDGQRWHEDSRDAASRAGGVSRHPSAAWRGLTAPSDAPCATCRGHTVLDGGVDVESDADLIVECPDC